MPAELISDIDDPMDGRVAVDDTNASGVSWGAVIAGATAAAALSLLLLMLGMGLGLSSITPWSYQSKPIGAATIAWLAFTQLAASGVGGYLAGRLRIGWARVHSDEVYFRDTAHGLLSWSVASLVSVVLLAGTAHTILNDAVDVGTGAASVAGEAGEFSNLPRASQTDVQRRADDADGRTSESRRHALDHPIATTKAAAEAARKAAAHSALWMFVALLFGAFIASVAATLGGRQRDSAHMQR